LVIVSPFVRFEACIVLDKQPVVGTGH
jgi:hypothetical protein